MEVFADVQEAADGDLNWSCSNGNGRWQLEAQYTLKIKLIEIADELDQELRETI